MGNPIFSSKTYKTHQQVVLECESYLSSVNYLGDFMSFPVGRFYEAHRHYMNNYSYQIYGVRCPSLPSQYAEPTYMCGHEYYVWQTIGNPVMFQKTIEPFIRSKAREVNIRYCSWPHPASNKDRCFGFVFDQNYSPRSSPPLSLDKVIYRYILQYVKKLLHMDEVDLAAVAAAGIEYTINETRAL